jgi:hypothetical protein
MTSSGVNGPSRSVDQPMTADQEETARSVIRRHARGMTHHDALAALEQVRDDEGQASGEPEAEEPLRRARIAEWERIVELLADHEGAYDPGTDAFVQGQLTAQANRQSAGPTTDQAAQEGRAALRQALGRAGLLDTSSDGQDTVVVRLATADPEAAKAVADWLDAAFAAGRDHLSDGPRRPRD